MAHLTRVALDTSILLGIERFRLDVFAELKEKFGHVEFLVPFQVKEELKALKKTNKTLAKSARIALELMKKNRVKIPKVDAKSTDEALISLSNQAFIASSDKLLLKKVLKNNGKALIIRQKKFIELV